MKRAHDIQGIVEKSAHESAALIQQAINSLKYLLEDWARWQGGYTMRLGYPTHSPGMGNHRVQSFDDMCEEVDSWTRQTIDAAVDDLPPPQKAAILRCYGIASTFNFPRDNYQTQLFSAHEHLLQELPRRGVVL